jgi:hypothetical protein
VIFTSHEVPYFGTLFPSEFTGWDLLSIILFLQTHENKSLGIDQILPSITLHGPMFLWIGDG